MALGVTLICMDCTENEMDQVKGIEYENLHIECMSWKTEGLQKVFQIILDTDDLYICFAERGKLSHYNKIQKMVTFLELSKNAGCVLCEQEYILKDGTHIGWMKQVFMRQLESSGSVLNGNAILEISLNLEENLFGGLTCCMLKREKFINKSFLLNFIECSKEEERLILIFECLYGLNVGRIVEKLVKTIEQDIDIEASLKEEKSFKGLKERILENVFKRRTGKSLELPNCYLFNKGIEDRRKTICKVKKDITLFYMGKAEYYILEPLIKEAERRGYNVSSTEDIGKEAEIGIYCSHIGCLQRGSYSAKFSVIMLHDMTQGEVDWPDFWNEEPWNGFDIGILPGKTWVKRWQSCSGFRYAHPKFGVYEAGYPKGDYIYNEQNIISSECLKIKLNMKYDKTILYAPSWENDGKEDDFIQALFDLPINLLIKQGIFRNYPQIRNNIIQMREMHEGKYNNVYYLDSDSNIMDAYSFCDVVVSDESGALTEALLFGKPSIAIMDWLVPDVTPSRYSFVPVDYVIKCNIAELRLTVEKIINERKQVINDKRKQIYSFIGKSSSTILDLVDYYTGQSDDKKCLETEVQPCHKLHGLWD